MGSSAAATAGVVTAAGRVVIDNSDCISARLLRPFYRHY
jgi:hypothetical protein